MNSLLSPFLLRRLLATPSLLILLGLLIVGAQLHAHDQLLVAVSEPLASQASGLGDKLGEATAHAIESYIGERIEACRLFLTETVEQFMADPLSYVKQNQWPLLAVLAVLLIVVSAICYLFSSVIQFLFKYGLVIGLVLLLIYLGVRFI